LEEFAEVLLSIEGGVTIGMDAEWLGQASPTRPRSALNAWGTARLKDGRVAVLQLATLERVLGSHVHVISLSAYERDGEPHPTLPQCLVRLLQSDDVLFVGHNIQGDATRLRKDFGVVIRAQSLSDTMPLSLQILGPPVPWDPRTRWSLSGLCKHFFGFPLDKNEDDRISAWETVPLSESQQAYAGLDALASLCVFGFVDELRTCQVDPSKAHLWNVSVASNDGTQRQRVQATFGSRVHVQGLGQGIVRRKGSAALARETGEEEACAGNFQVSTLITGTDASKLIREDNNDNEYCTNQVNACRVEAWVASLGEGLRADGWHGEAWRGVARRDEARCGEQSRGVS